MKKRILLIIAGTACTVLVLFALARELQPLPVDGVLYFDSDTEIAHSKAYELNLKTKRLRQIQVEGYSHISSLTPVGQGYYCLGLLEADGERYVLYCEGQSAKYAIPVEHLLTYETQPEPQSFCVYEEGVLFRVPGADGGIYYADFNTMTVQLLPGGAGGGSFLSVQDGMVYYSDLSGNVFCLEDGEPRPLINQRAFMPLFADSGTLLYLGEVNGGGRNSVLLQYDLGTGQSASSALHYDPLRYFSPGEYEGGRAAADGWLIGYQPGLLREWHVTGTGKTTAVNLETGQKTTILKLLWRDAEHLAYAAAPVYD